MAVIWRRNEDDSMLLRTNQFDRDKLRMHSRNLVTGSTVSMRLDKDQALALADAIRSHYGQPIVPRHANVCGRTETDELGRTHTCMRPLERTHAILTTAGEHAERYEMHGCLCGRSFMTPVQPEPIKPAAGCEGGCASE